MANCTKCGKTLTLPKDDTCNECHDLERHLPRYLSSGAGRAFVAQAVRDVEVLVAEQERAKRKAIRDARIDEYKKLGRVALQAKVNDHKDLLTRMVGNLYPGVVQNELDEMEEALQELTWQ